MLVMQNSLNSEQARFALWLTDEMPHLAHLFDWQDAAYKPDALKQYLAAASHDESIMARFVIGVWRRENEFDFDLIEASLTLDEQQRKIISDWLLNPILP